MKYIDFIAFNQNYSSEEGLNFNTYSTVTVMTDEIYSLQSSCYTVTNHPLCGKLFNDDTVSLGKVTMRNGSIYIVTNSTINAIKRVLSDYIEMVTIKREIDALADAERSKKRIEDNNG